MKGVLIGLVVTGMASAALAQHLHGSTPYAGQQQRDVKALSDQQMADLRGGRGMSLALAGELNGYPGPLHLIELADQLNLSPEQRQHIEGLSKDMKSEAIAAGNQLIEHERALDCAFASREITTGTLDGLTARIGEAQGRLRAVHLKYHLSTAALLSGHQRHQYAMLRGYR